MHAANRLRNHCSVETEKAAHCPDSAEKSICRPAIHTARLRSHSHPPANSSTPTISQATPPALLARAFELGLNVVRTYGSSETS